jgi:hypothetical protein
MNNVQWVLWVSIEPSGCLTDLHTPGADDEHNELVSRSGKRLPLILMMLIDCCVLSEWLVIIPFIDLC